MGFFIVRIIEEYNVFFKIILILVDSFKCYLRIVLDIDWM